MSVQEDYKEYLDEDGKVWKLKQHQEEFDLDKRAREILRRYFNGAQTDWTRLPEDTKAVDVGIDQIKSLLRDFSKYVTPERIDNWKDVDPKKIGERTASSGNLGLYRMAHNQTISEIEANIRKALGDE